MLDLASARFSAYTNNITRYRRLLETNLTELEREYVQRRLFEVQSELETLEAVATLPPRPNRLRTDQIGQG